MSQAFIGQITLFAGNFAPRNWAFCNGQIMNITQNTALFSILGTTYGGNGQTTFGLPDLRGRVPVHCGNSTGPGLSPYNLGQQSGTESVTLTTPQMPLHNHPATATLTADASPGSTSAPASANIAQVVLSAGRPPTLANSFTTGTPANPAQLAGAAVTVGPAGGSQPHGNIQPILGLNYIICLFGIFPSRN